jgi:hypothetical protein
MLDQDTLLAIDAAVHASILKANVVQRSEFNHLSGDSARMADVRRIELMIAQKALGASTTVVGGGITEAAARCPSRQGCRAPTCSLSRAARLRPN